MNPSESENHLLPPTVKYIAESTNLADMDMFLVGGVLRDSILGTTNPDIDIAVIGSSLEMAKKIAQTTNSKWFPLDMERDIYRVVSGNYKNNIQIDIASGQNDISIDVSALAWTTEPSGASTLYATTC